MSFKHDSEQMNVETAYGIVDIYTNAKDINGGEITSFVMSGQDTCNLKQRIDGLIAVEFDIEVM